MKIVSRQEFLLLPENTLFCKFEPNYFGEIEIKVCIPGSYINDFITDSIFRFVETNESSQDKLLDTFKVGTEFRWDDDQTMRDGMFENDNVMFCIYDNQDIEQLIDKLKKCIK